MDQAMDEFQGEFDFDQMHHDFKEQQENLDRVSSRIAWAIVRFLCERLASINHFFHADELRAAVIRDTGIAAPASADRVLRDLRQKKKIGYRVVNRRESLYEALWVAGA
jgi:hypothetical protein